MSRQSNNIVEFIKAIDEDYFDDENDNLTAEQKKKAIAVWNAERAEVNFQEEQRRERRLLWIRRNKVKIWGIHPSERIEEEKHKIKTEMNKRR